MRLGQAACEIESIPSDPEIRVALVPLTEAEYDQCLEKMVSIEAPDNISGNQLRDRVNTREILVRSIREPDALEERMFEGVEEMNATLEATDMNYLIDVYFEMVEQANPKADGLTDEQISDLKKVLLEVDLSDLSGKQWYSLRRFLSSLGPELLMDKLLGSSLISQSTTMSGLSESIPENAETDSPSLTAKSAENQ